MESVFYILCIFANILFLPSPKLKDGQSLKDLYEERVPLYEKYADITIDEEGKDLDESLRAILEIIHIKEQGK